MSLKPGRQHNTLRQRLWQPHDIAYSWSASTSERCVSGGDVNMPVFLTAKNLKPFIPNELRVTSSQIEFRPFKRAMDEVKNGNRSC